MVCRGRTAPARGPPAAPAALVIWRPAATTCRPRGGCPVAPMPARLRRGAAVTANGGEGPGKDGTTVGRQAPTATGVGWRASRRGRRRVSSPRCTPLPVCGPRRTAISTPAGWGDHPMASAPVGTVLTPARGGAARRAGGATPRGQASPPTTICSATASVGGGACPSGGGRWLRGVGAAPAADRVPRKTTFATIGDHCPPEARLELPRRELP